MWNQVILVAGAFALGYYFATRGSAPKGNSSKLPGTAEGGDATMVGSFPEQDSASEASRPAAKHAAGKKKPKKHGSKKKHSGHASSPTGNTEVTKQTSMESTARDIAGPSTSSSKTKGKKPASEVEAAPVQAVEAQLEVSEDTAGGSDEQETEEWETVGDLGARPEKKSSNPIPAHESVWDDLESDEDLGKEPEQASAPARVLRIGAAARPPPMAPRRPQRPQIVSEPLTKKQRQNMRKQERKREEREYASQLQDQRLRQHQRALEDVRSREQWEKAKRQSSKKQPTAPRSSRTNGTASVFNDRLIWD